MFDYLNFYQLLDETIVVCEDHLKRLGVQNASERYCIRCKIPVCSSCIIDYHSSHIEDSKTKIEDYITNQRKEVIALKPFVLSNQQKHDLLNSLRKDIESQKIDFQKYLEKRKLEIDETKSLLDKIYSQEKKLFDEMDRQTEEKYSQLYNTNLKEVLEKSSYTSTIIQDILDSWDRKTKVEKMDIIQKNKISILKQDANKYLTKRNFETDLMKNSIKEIIDKINKSRLQLKAESSFSNVMRELNNINNTIKNKLEQMPKNNNQYKQNDIPKYDKNEIFNNNFFQSGFADNNNIFNHKNNNQDLPSDINKNNNPQNMHKRGNSNNDFKIQEKYENNLTKDGNQNKANKDNFFKNLEQDNYQRKFNNFAFLGDNNNSNFNILFQSDDYANNNFTKDLIASNQIHIINERDIADTPILKSNSFACEYFIAIKPKSKQIKIFDSKNKKIYNYELNNLMFNESESFLTEFLANCRFVNLGCSALVSGGLVNTTQVATNYLILVSRNRGIHPDNENCLSISIFPYSPMNETRERHCLIYAHDKKKILACSGCLNNTVEIANIQTGDWKSIQSLREMRANASGAYVNNRYIYIFGGFKLNNGTGFYINSAEILDLNNENSNWKFVDFDNKFTNSIKITAAGVLNYSNEKILLCGGYNGQAYMTEVYCVEYKDDNIEKYEKTRLNLNEEVVFFNSAFVRCGGSFVNVDHKIDFHIYDPLRKEFQIYN